MADYGTKISLPGKDISSSNPYDFALNSKYGSFKAKNNNDHIFQGSGNFTGPFPPNQTIAIFSVAHGYPYAPAGMAVLKLDNLNGPPNTQWGTGSVSIGATLYVGVITTPTDLVVLVYDNGSWIKNGTVLDFSYYIFAEDGK